MSKIEVQNLDLYYGEFHALKQINMEFRANEVTAMIVQRYLLVAE